MASNTDDKEVLGLFGATGQTGKHVVQCALDLGWEVRAMVRSPGKLTEEIRNHNSFTLIQGDFSNGDAIQETLEGVTRVICCAGGPHKAREYDNGFMERFVTEQLWPALQESKPKSFLYQAGALSKLSTFPSPSQIFVAPLMGLGPMAKDNDAVMRFIHSHPLESTFVVVTRPGSLIGGKGGSDLRTSCWAPMMPVCFADLGKFNVSAVLDESLVGRYPYIARKFGF